MSFIAGYILGCGDVGDRRVKMLDKLETLYKININDEWNVRVKIASDIDNMQYFQFGNTHGGIVNYITQWTMYYCVYLNDEFKYATCNNPFWTKYQENYQNADVPNRLYNIYRNSGFKITSAEASFRTGGSFLSISVKGTYTSSTTAYSWTNDTDRIEGETTDTAETFSDSKSDFDGSRYGGHYIVNGNADDFKNYVYGLYAVCRARALAEKS
ncbi:hypothetical protein [Huintestinicola sp.]